MQDTPSAARRLALLIGSPYGGLLGVATDMGNMSARLDARGFECRSLLGPEATRERILVELERLRDEATPSDAIVVYYAGHGGRAHLRDATDDDSSVPHNFLVPIDYANPVDHARPSAETHGAPTCRGIADFELTLLLYDISCTTHNVTLIFDCCHSSTMVRGDEQDELFEGEAESRPSERIRKLGGARLYRMPTDMATRYAEYQRRIDELHGDSNPHVVRLVATAAGSSAFEAPTGDSSQGYLTRELCAALDDTLHAPVCWDVIIRRIRERIFTLRSSTTQRPELEGPRNRLPFSLNVDADVVDRSTLTYRSDGTPFVRMGRLHGLHPRDRLDILDQANATIARADIDELFDDTARVTIRASADLLGSSSPTRVRMPSHLNGNTVSVSSYEHRASVWIDPTLAHAASLRTHAEAQMRLRLVDDPTMSDFRVRGDAQALYAEGPPWLHRLPRSAERDSGIAMIDDLDDLARAMVLEQALQEPSAPPLPFAWHVELLVATPGEDPRPLAHDESLPVETRLHFVVRHSERGASSMYVNVIDRGVSGRTYHQNPSQPAGVQVRAPQGEGSSTVRIPGLGTSIRLVWPPDVPRDRPLAEEFLVLASQRPLDLRDLMTLSPGIRARGHEAPIETSREGQIEVTRIAPADPDLQLGRSLPRDIRRFRFHLCP